MTVSANRIRSLRRLGPMGEAIAALDDRSPLGPVSDWSVALTNAVTLILPSQAEIVLFWGPELCALYNATYAPTIGDKHPAALGQPARLGWAELWDDLEPLLRGVIDTGVTFSAKDRAFYLERDGGRGETAYFDISYSAVTDDDGSVGGVLCIVSETTRRVLAERATTAERDRLWALARDPFLVAARDGTWLAASPAWTELLGWRENELIGRTSQWMEHPDDRSATRAEVRELAGGRETIRFENRFRARDGRYHTFAWTAVPEGDLLYCVARDVTAERDGAAALEEAEAALRQAQKMETVGQLTGGVAHDFNNLLQVITGNLEIIERNLPDDAPRLRRSAAAAMKGATRAAALTQRLLAFSRRQPLAPTLVDPVRLMGGIGDLLQRTIGETVAIRTVADDAVWPIEVDVNQMENALLNLAINARDAMPNGGRLTIEIVNAAIGAAEAARDAEIRTGDYVALCVTDTGGGMDADTVARAFDPFFTTKDVGRGTGLGLSMVYGFIRQSGGHVWIDSAPGCGTTIRMYLPRADGIVAAEEVREPPTADGGTETILVCEDDADVRAYTTETLRDLGYQVIEAGDGAAALAAIERYDGAIDLLFTDVVLPGGMTGADLAAAAGVQQPRLKVLFTTGYARNAIVHHGRLDPGVDLITKPFSRADLAARIRGMLDR